ncbi:MAG: glycosyltransferase family 39 protein [Candidatus Levybacteria bacterium]|nr:glycosyltransferase family 39 protein [Candidatus Levybacteria bacterium]
MNKKSFLILLAVFFLGAFLRFYNLGDVPAGFHRDEVFLGYNAHSLLKTGHDISGNFLPLHFKSFLFSPAGYSYFSIPFIAIFGLTEFSVRFASALFGSLTIIVTYCLVRELFGYREKMQNHTRNNAEIVALFSSFLLAITPWHINLSRTATENVIAVFFIALGTLLYLRFLKSDKNYLLILSFLLFGITILIYQAPRVFLPFFIPLMILFTKDHLNIKKIKLQLLLFLTIIIIPLFFILLSKDFSLRMRTVSVFSTQQTQLIIDEQIRGDGVSNLPVWLAKFFHNKPLGYSQQIITNYFKHFSYDFLFTDSGFPDRYRVPLTGLLYIFELPLLIFGGLFLFINNKKIGLFLISWVFLASLGSALTFDDVPNLQRTLLVFPALSVVSGFGFLGIVSFLKDKRRILIPSMILGSLIVLYSIFFYLHQYYVHMNMYRPWYRNDGYKELIGKVNVLLPGYQKAIVTNYESAPTIFFLFYTNYNPSAFQKQTKSSTLKDFDRIAFANYEFSQEQCPVRIEEGQNGTFLIGEKNILYVNSGLCKVPKGVKILEEVRRGDNSLVFRIIALR